MKGKPEKCATALAKHIVKQTPPHKKSRFRIYAFRKYNIEESYKRMQQ